MRCQDHGDAAGLVNGRKTAGAVIERAGKHDANEAAAGLRGHGSKKQIDGAVSVKIKGAWHQLAEIARRQGQVGVRLTDIATSVTQAFAG